MNDLNNFFKGLGFKKEERNEHIGLYSARISWLFTTIILLVWSLWGLVTTGRLEPQFLVFSISQAVYWLMYIYYRNKFGG